MVSHALIPIKIATATRVFFGEGARYSLSQIIPVQGNANVLLVASRSSLQRAEIADMVHFIEAFARVVYWDRVRSNPRTIDIDDCLKEFANSNITHVVGIGGGSVLDQAKATAMALSSRVPVSQLLKQKIISKRTNTLILIPTTSGTGSELSHGAILTNSETGEKLGLRGENIAADYALVDPQLTWGLPANISMLTGFDVLAHALETWLSTVATPYTKDLSRGAIIRTFRWLPILHSDLSNREARKEMSYASMVMGINLALSSTCLPHRLQYPIGAATDTAHAAGLVAIYPSWLDYVLPHAGEKLNEAASWVGAKNASQFVQQFKELLLQIGLTTHLQDLGVNEEMIARFPSEVTGRLSNDPSYRNQEDLAVIYNMAFHR